MIRAVEKVARTTAIVAVLIAALWFGFVVRPFQPVSGKVAPVERRDPLMLAAKASYRSVQGPDLIVPVMGASPSQLQDTFTDARVSGARHDAIDVMAPAGTPVVSAAAGRVEKIFLSKDGGNTVYARSTDGSRIYYYAHLDKYAQGLTEGQRLDQGSLIGFVGSTGNADPAAPHLHFAIWQTSPDRQWWEEGVPLNPYDLLRPAKSDPVLH